MFKLFQVFIPKGVVAVIILDFIVIAGTVLAVSGLALSDVDIWLLYERGIESVVIVSVSIMAGLYWNDAYSTFRIRSRVILAQQVAIALGLALLLQALLAYALAETAVPKRVMLLSTPVLLVALSLWRILYSKVIHTGFRATRVLMLGVDSVGIEIEDGTIARPELGLEIIGYLDDKQPKGMKPGSRASVIGPICDLSTIVSIHHPEQIIVNTVERRQVVPVETLLNLRLSGIRIHESSSFYEQVFGRVATKRLRPSHLIFSPELGPSVAKLRLQTIYSFIAALIGITVLSPVMILVALAVRLTSRGPVLFRQKRVGLNGKNFEVYKFRSMVVDAEARTGAVWATKNDPRVTVIGGLLRRTRLDELPQLFNVIRGEMVLVGPRPERPEFVSVLTEQIPFYRQRHCVKPGVTGWAQINYKYGETLEDTIVKLEYDLYYIKNVSFTLDVFVVLHTLKVMLASDHGQ